MSRDNATKESLAAALALARTGRFQNHGEVLVAIKAAGSYAIALEEPRALALIEQHCRKCIKFKTSIRDPKKVTRAAEPVMRIKAK